jgi:hypothetical protein
MSGVEGRTIIVTGAGQGSAALALHLAKARRSSWSIDRVERTAGSARVGAEVLGLTADIGDHD